VARARIANAGAESAPAFLFRAANARFRLARRVKGGEAGAALVSHADIECIY